MVIGRSSVGVDPKPEITSPRFVSQLSNGTGQRTSERVHGEPGPTVVAAGECQSAWGRDPRDYPLMDANQIEEAYPSSQTTTPKLTRRNRPRSWHGAWLTTCYEDTAISSSRKLRMLRSRSGLTSRRSTSRKRADWSGKRYGYIATIGI
jgi:hypothetical protein